MGPAPTTFDNMLPSSSSALFNIPKLADDGTNWITYKERLLTTISARGLMRYVEGRAVKLEPFKLDPKGKKLLKEDTTEATEAEWEAREDKIDEWYQKDSLAKQHIFSTIMNRLLLRIKKLGDASKIWAEICKIHEGKTELVQVDLRRRLQDTRCEEGNDVRNHFGEMMRMQEELAGMGTVIEECDFYAILLGSLLESYRPLLSSINATARIAKTPLSPYELVNIVSEEYEHRQLSSRGNSKKGGNTALSAKTGAKNDRAGNRSDVTCFNCDRKGHYKSDCWRAGGRKEGQGPSQGQRKWCLKVQS